MKQTLVSVLALFSVIYLLPAASQPPPGGGPWNNDLYIGESSDGLRFVEPRRFVDRGGVVSLARDREGRLIAAFQWFPFDQPEAFDRIAVMTSQDDGKSWSQPSPIQVLGLPEGHVRPFDPTLVPLEDGRVRLYFSGHARAGRDPTTYSAVSADGMRYRFEPGVRFAVEGERVIDCAVGRLGKTWHYYAPVQGQPGRGYHAVSDDGLRFTRQPDVSVPGSRHWLGCVVAAGDGLRFYGTGDGGWSATSRDGSTWQLDPQTRGIGADPGVARAGNGRYLMIATGPPRSDRVAAPPGAFGPGPAPGLPPRMAPPGETVMTATGDFLYLFHRGVLYQFDARDLRLIRQIRLPEGGGEPRERIPPPPIPTEPQRRE
jgi:hypothetical protein